MKNILEVLRQKEGELRRIEDEVRALRIAAQLVGEEKDQIAAPDDKLTQVEMIRTVLRDCGKPMHVKEMAEAIKSKFKKQLKPSYLAPVIYRQLGKRFTKADRPNTFGLIEWPMSGNSQPQLSIVNR
jgi:hypothetical protein